MHQNPRLFFEPPGTGDRSQRRRAVPCRWFTLSSRRSVRASAMRIANHGLDVWCEAGWSGSWQPECVISIRRVGLEDLREVVGAVDRSEHVDGEYAVVEGRLVERPVTMSEIYAALGVSAAYDPTTRSAQLSVAIPRSAETVSEGGLAV